MDIHNRDQQVCLNEASLCLWGRDTETINTNGKYLQQKQTESVGDPVQTLVTKERPSQERRTM